MELRRRSWWRRLLGPGRFTVFVLVLLLAAAAGYLGWRAYTLDRAATALASERADALRAASHYAVDLTSYDYRDLDTAVNSVAAEATQPFATRYRTAADTRAAGLRTDRSVSTGTVVGAGIEAETPGRSATVLVLVHQSVTNTGANTPRVERSELRMTLTRSADHWLIDDLVLL